MRVIGGFLKPATVPRIAEGDPLPPEDRLVVGAALAELAAGRLPAAHDSSVDAGAG